jgi:8-oxo-dGTP pyrophosphatase MutT (NUDIX family)
MTTISESSSASHSGSLVEGLKTALVARPGKKLLGGNYEDLPRAAVSIILVLEQKTGQELKMLLIKRNERDDDPWSGQMAFPGGRSRTGDSSLLSTAKRETLEETGIDLEKCEIMGQLDEVVSGRHAVRVSPFIAFSEVDPQVRIDRSEVSDYFWIPYGFFRDKNNITSYSIERGGEILQVPSYRYGEENIVWGMTFRIIEDFLSKTQSFNSA